MKCAVVPCNATGEHTKLCGLHYAQWLESGEMKRSVDIYRAARCEEVEEADVGDARQPLEDFVRRITKEEQ